MIGAIIQARMGSTRLPGKVLMDLGGKPVLRHVIDRVKLVPEIERIVVATSREQKDDAIAAKCREWGVRVYRGDETDVLDRYFKAAALHLLTVVVRITADCPLLDPTVVSRVIQEFQAAGCEYASNVHPPSYPDGLDCEVMSIAALQTAWDEAGSKFDREHVTPYLWHAPGRFGAVNVSSTGDTSSLRWTLDTPADLDLIRALHQSVQPGHTDYRELLGR